MDIDLIYCADGNSRLAQIAIDAGFRYGAQLPNTVYFPPWFVDQDWHNPDRERYMRALEEYRPVMATVLDWEREDQLPEVLDWAEEAAQYVERVLIVPKVIGGVSDIPRRIGGREVILAYSVPTRYAGTQLPVWEFDSWPIHLLGGSPQAQMRLTHYMSVVSADGNMACKMAHRCRFWQFKRGPKGHWFQLRDVGDGGWGRDANYEAFRRSCQNVIEAWENMAANGE